MTATALAQTSSHRMAYLEEGDSLSSAYSQGNVFTTLRFHLKYEWAHEARVIICSKGLPGKNNPAY